MISLAGPVPDGRDAVAFPRLTDAEVAALVPLGRPRALRDREPLFTAGDRQGGFFLVLKGSVEIRDRSRGEERGVVVHEAGEFTGDIDILTRRRPVVSAIARGRTEVLAISPSEIRRIIRDSPGLGEKILRAFIARRELLMEAGFQGLRVLGHGSSRDAFRVREFLARNQVPFTWIDLDQEPGVEELLVRFGIRPGDTPVVARGAEALLRNPTTTALAELAGLRMRFTGKTVYDLLVVGAGPAGLAAAVYGASEGLRTLVLDASAPGGQAGSSSRIENYLGFPTGISGAELTGRATLQAQKFGARFSTPCEAAGLRGNGATSTVVLEDGAQVSGRCVLIATGADYRQLDVPGRERFDGLGVYYAATPTELAGVRGSEVVVVGGGNSAGQAATFLADHADRVHLLLRGNDLRRGMSSYLATRIEQSEKIRILPTTEVTALRGADRVEEVALRNTTTGEERTVRTPAVFTFIGASPRTGWLAGAVEMDRHGFILTGRGVGPCGEGTTDREPYTLETSHPGVFAAGDVRAGSIKRVASAVGEGAMVVKYAHACLAEMGEKDG